MPVTLPSLPYPEFPLRPHQNGQWSKTVWNPTTRRSETVYFGAWVTDPNGERALHDPITGWLARRAAIKAGTDRLRQISLPSVGALCLGELMQRFLTSTKRRCDAGDLSARTLGDYLTELPKFVAFFGAATPVDAMLAEHFSAYMHALTDRRKLGRHSRRRVRAYVNAMFAFAVKNGWSKPPATGSDWVAPATDPESMRISRMRSGKPDYQHRIINGEELDQLLGVASPPWRAMLLLGVNCGLGPADIGRLRWKHLSLVTGRLDYPRGKTGVTRVGYLWQKTRKALRRVEALERTKRARERDGDEALVFISRRGDPMYHETPEWSAGGGNTKEAKRLVGIKSSRSIPCTFYRLAKNLGFKGLSFYRLRHTTKTLGKAARDSEALDLVMGHANRSIGRLYDHSELGFKRVRHVAIAIKNGLWPKVVKRGGGSQTQSTTATRDVDDVLMVRKRKPRANPTVGSKADRPT